ncbi:MAG: RloB domain-containing protein [Bacteroidales bacterium]|nr:RloB domain-containing protein [Bacteroidales bacterium]
MSMRQGNRRVRKSIAIIGEGLTEYRYIDDMCTTERYRFSLVPGMPKHSDIDDIVMLARERMNAGYDYVLCLIDMDVIEGNHDKMEHYRALKRDNPEIIFVESSPCTEYWFLMHYMPGPSSREYADYNVVLQELKKHILNYEKTEAFFNKTHIYRELKDKGDMERAIDISRELDKLHETELEVYKSYTQMYKLFDIISEITKE